MSLGISTKANMDNPLGSSFGNPLGDSTSQLPGTMKTKAMSGAPSSVGQHLNAAQHATRGPENVASADMAGGSGKNYGYGNHGLTNQQVSNIQQGVRNSPPIQPGETLEQYFTRIAPTETPFLQGVLGTVEGVAAIAAVVWGGIALGGALAGGAAAGEAGAGAATAGAVADTGGAAVAAGGDAAVAAVTPESLASAAQAGGGMYAGLGTGAVDTTGAVGAGAGAGASSAYGTALEAGAIQGGVTGLTTSALSSVIGGKPITAGSLGRGALTGAVGGAVGSVLPSGGGVAGAAERGSITGAVGSALNHQNPLIGAAVGGIGAGVGSAVSGETGNSFAGGVAGGLAKAATGAELASGVTSSGGHPVAAQPYAGGVPGDTTGSTSSPGSFLSGATDALGGSTGSSLVQFGVPAAAGMIAANSANKDNANLAGQLKSLGQPDITAGNQLLDQFQQGKLTPQQQAVVDTATKAGSALVTDPNTKTLQQIASTAFQNYNTQTLTPADAKQVADWTAQAKAQLRQSLGANVDSSSLAQYDAQIDAQGQQMKQDLLTKQFQTGDTAYNQWLSTTEQGQNMILQGQQYAVSSLNNMLNQSLQLTQTGMGPIQDAINLEVASNTQTAAQIQQLLTGLTQAYALSQYRKQNPSGSPASTPSSSSGGGSQYNSPGSVPQAQTPAGDSMSNIQPMTDPSLNTNVDLSGVTDPNIDTSGLGDVFSGGGF